MKRKVEKNLVEVPMIVGAGSTKDSCILLTMNIVAHSKENVTRIYQSNAQKYIEVLIFGFGRG